MSHGATAWRSLVSATWWWVVAAAVASLASMHSFAQIQRTLLRSAGVHLKQWRSEAAYYAGNALSTTMPGGPVLSATFLYRLVSWIFLAAIGWVVFFFMFRTEKDIDPDAVTPDPK